MDKNKLLLVLTTVPSKEAAETLSAAVLESRLAACVNVIPGVASRYWWKNALESAEELILLIKCPEGNYDALEQAIRAAHPYETPEIMALEAVRVFQAYKDWVFATALK